MPLPPPALPWLLAACCLCALPRGSGFPQPLSRYRDGAELPKSQQLALCFSQWMELSNQPQVSCLRARCFCTIRSYMETLNCSVVCVVVLLFCVVFFFLVSFSSVKQNWWEIFPKDG
ncbi:hypothetical protein CIB84_004180 [Bambusicola thoracicus]|uniref:Uncharacterized protein n=1 Tax=Bambusicola thoracicus TaxID=9083 RepID=A0A2P4T6T7_BAMTH|nr:hypothetical protein CIB84_004180 [Bambusicola thoracicus]